MMKKTVSLFFALLLLTGIFASSSAEEEEEEILLPDTPASEEAAQNISADCSWRFSTKKQNYKKWMTDGNFNTSWQKAKKTDGWIEITPKTPGQMIGSVYICLDIQQDQWELQVRSGDGWVTVWEGPSPYVHVFIPLDSPAEAVRFWFPKDTKRAKVAEIAAFSPGSTPSEVQIWEPTFENADILFLATHADDELIFFGGGIPTYATERKNKTVVAYLADCGARRTHELLNGLWSMGVRNYPVIAPFKDTAQKTMSKEYKEMGGQAAVRNWMVSLFRQVKPKVVVTHDVNGEYGHAQHKVCAAVAKIAYDAAADPSVDPASAEAYGTWQVQKLYLHLAKENQITMDWSVPLSSLGGITGLDAAIRAFTFHVSQQEYDMNVTRTGKRYDNRIFGLVRTEVGPDEACDDFLEHIDLSSGQPE